MAKSYIAPPGVILLSAGRGTRMQPLTEGLPKSLFHVGHRRVLDHLSEAVISRTEGKVVLVTGYGGDKVVSHLGERYGNRVITVETIARRERQHPLR